uniref:Uncharacterized protein n=1 Tax=Ixodes ricinus TaxID=34613 RepID=A0A6B0UMJ2_IXORI
MWSTSKRPSWTLILLTRPTLPSHAGQSPKHHWRRATGPIRQLKHQARARGLALPFVEALAICFFLKGLPCQFPFWLSCQLIPSVVLLKEAQLIWKLCHAFEEVVCHQSQGGQLLTDRPQ